MIEHSLDLEIADMHLELVRELRNAETGSASERTSLRAGPLGNEEEV